MKRFLFYLLALAPMSAFAQLNGSGFYRVQNENTKRYITIVDNRAYRVGNTGVDLKAMYLQKEEDFDEKVACNPASVCYIDVVNGSQLDLIGQGLQLSKYNYLLNYIQKSGDVGYRLYGSSAGISIYLIDTNRGTSPGTLQGGGQGNIKWLFLPVNQSDTQYFGVKPDITASADGSYWSTMYAGFPFTPSTSATKVYTVNSVKNGYAIIKEIAQDVPAQTPVLFRCGSANASDNKLTLKSVTTSGSVGANYLRGNYYCNDVIDTDSEKPHRNVVSYNPSTMRMLGTTSDGKPAFVKANISYLPANKCYLSVSSSAPDVLQIVTEAEYEEMTGIEEVISGVTEGAKVIYDLQGRRVAAPSKGVYIVNGKKVIVK